MAVSENPQVNAALRHGLSFVGGATTLLAVLGMIDPSQVKDIMSGIQQTMDGLSTATAGLSKIIYIVGPMLGAAGALYAAKSANVLNQISSALHSAAKGDDSAKAAIVSAAASLPEVQTIVAPGIAVSVPNNKVVP